MTWHRTDHLPLKRHKVPPWTYPRISYTWLTKHTRETKEEWELSPVPTLSYVSVDTSSQCKASLDYCICNKSILFYYTALLAVYSFVTDGFIYSALKDSETMGHIHQSTPLSAINCSSMFVISIYAWSCSFTNGYLQELCRLLTDRLYHNERYC